MTREMNKPEYHVTWYFKMIDSVDSINRTFEIPKERTLDDWIKPFFDKCCRMEKVNVGKR